MQVRHRRRRAAAALVTAIVLAGCNSGEREPEADEADGEVAAAPELSVTIPPERQTPFCQAMIDLNDELLNDPPADSRARIIEVYQSIVDDVPPEIEVDFLAVLARLQSGGAAAGTTLAPVPAASPATAPGASAVPVTTSPFADEGYDPDADPTTRLAEYVRFACRDSVNNPGPSATQPGTPTVPG